MDALTGLVRRLVRAFEKASVDYAFTGALAASFYGVPRSTVDVDIVVGVSGDAGRDGLVSALRCADVKVDGREIEKASESGYRIATFDDVKSGFSVDRNKLGRLRV